MSTSWTKRESRFPWWVKLTLGVLVLAAISLGLVYFLGRASTARWERYAARLREGGVPLTYEEIEALRTQIPEEQNGALVIERLTERLNEVEPTWEQRFVLIFGRRSDKADFFTGIARHQIEPSRSFLEEYRDLLKELAILREMPTGRFEINYTENPLETVLPHLTPVRTASKLLHLDSVLKLIDGDMEGSAATVRIQAHVSATLDECPTIIGRVVQIAIDAKTLRTIENIMRVGELDEQTLVALDEDVEARLKASTMKWGFLGERAFLVGVCEQIATGNLSLGYLDILASGGPGVQWLPRFMVRWNQMRGAEILTWLVEAVDDPQRMIKATQRIDTTVPAEPITRILVRFLLPDLSRSVVLHIRITARLECARVALTAERFRLHDGRLPESIEELIPDYLEAVPTDPFSGEPMRFAVTDEGIVIYSVYEDGEDDGGIAVRQETRPNYLDIGFRLLKADRRGLLIIDEPPPEDD